MRLHRLYRLMCACVKQENVVACGSRRSRARVRVGKKQKGSHAVASGCVSRWLVGARFQPEPSEASDIVVAFPEKLEPSLGQFHCECLAAPRFLARLLGKFGPG